MNIYPTTAFDTKNANIIHTNIYIYIYIYRLNVIFKSVAFAIMVSKFDNVRPKLYFTPLMVINFRNKTPVLQFRVMNSRALLDVNLTAQWAKPTRSEEGETFGKLYDVKMTAFQMISRPSPYHIPLIRFAIFGQKLQKLKGVICFHCVVGSNCTKGGTCYDIL